MEQPSEPTRKQLYEAYDIFLFDADGVLWRGESVIDGAIDALRQLVEAKKTVIVVSNNATRTPAQFVEKFHKLGFNFLTEANVISSAMVAIDQLFHHPQKSNLPVYLIGTPALAEMLLSVGVRSIGVGQDLTENCSKNGLITNVSLEEKVFAVMTSYDPHFNYIKIMKAVNYLHQENVEFFATNEDLTFPGSNPNIVVPGAGCTSIPVSVISNRQPQVFGKPHSAMFEYICKHHKIDLKRTLMIGDRLDTDIWFGNRNGFDTLLVLTGVSTLATVQKAIVEHKSQLIPKHYMQSIKYFVE